MRLAIKAEHPFSLEPINAPAILSNTFGFPFDQRWAMGIWAMMFNNADRRFELHADLQRGVEPLRLSRSRRSPIASDAIRRAPVRG